MGIYKQIMVLTIFGMLNLCVLSNVVCEEINPDNNDIDGNEIEEMLETLEKERAVLKELKSKLHGTSKLRDDTIRNVTDEATKVQKEKEVKTASGFVLANEKNEIENKERALNKDDSFTLSKKRNMTKEIITPKHEDDEMKEIKKAVKNGEEIVHPFEIAESLYKLGGYKSALDIYKLINKNSLEEDKKVWITYQIANCYRKQELFNEAVKVYKDMVNEFEGTYWAKQAQWYIQDIQWRTKADVILEKVVKG